MLQYNMWRNSSSRCSDNKDDDENEDDEDGDVLQIATELSRLIQLAGTNMLSTEDITGGTITVSNFGAIGGKFGCPLLNVPEVAIVAIGRMQEVMRPLSYGNRDVANVLNVSVVTSFLTPE